MLVMLPARLRFIGNFYLSDESCDRVLTFDSISMFWVKQIVCPGSYIRSPGIRIC